MIWGSVISLGGKSAMRLYWTPSREIKGAKETGKYQPETIALPTEFWSDLRQKGLLSQTRLAEITFGQERHYVADRLAPLIDQVRKLVQSKEGAWDQETLAGVRSGLAVALEIIGEQAGKSEPLGKRRTSSQGFGGMDPRALAAPMGSNAEQSRQRACEPRRAREYMFL